MNARNERQDASLASLGFLPKLFVLTFSFATRRPAPPP